MNDALHIDRRQFLGQLSLGGLALNEMLALESKGRCCRDQGIIGRARRM